MSNRLVEVQPFQYEVLKEAKKRDGVLMVLEGIFQRADTQNANKRVYPRALWNKIMTDEDTNERLGSRRMLGELDHPASGSTSTHRVSHVITEHKLLPNGEIRGKMEVLDTPAGRIAETLFKAGVQLGISSRGDGSVERRGDTSEVQEDFRLETYDLVLKPSTPGAYPQIVESEEAARKNNELIADAVEGLVKSTADVDVLLECHKIITVLEAGPRCDAILKDLKSKLSGPDPRVAQPEESEPKVTEETHMSGTNKNQSPELSPEMAAFLKEQVDRGIAEAVKAKDDKISELNEMIVELTTQKEDLGTKLEAATKLVDEFQRSVDELKEEKTDNTELQEKYEAACKLLDEAVEKLQVLGDTQRRLEASNSLLAVSIGRHKAESVGRKVDELIGDLEEDVQKKLRPFLEECENAAEVQTRFDELASLVESVRPSADDSREPLPTKQNRSGAITESASKPNGGRKHQNFVTNRLLNRLGGVAQ